MKLSIIIPCYNVQNSISLLLNSIFVQIKNRDVEVICVNDGSADQTLDVLSNIRKSNQDLHIIDQENGGPALARNAGLDMATGEYVWFVDGDDIIDKNAIDILLHEIKNKPTDIICFNYKEVDVSGNIIQNRYQQNYDYSCTYNGSEAFSKFKVPAYLWNRIIRRNLIEENSIRFGIIPEDEDFLIHTYLVAKSFRFIKSCLYLYKQFDISFSKSISTYLKYYDGYYLIMKKYCNYTSIAVHNEFWNYFLFVCLKNVIINYNRVKIASPLKKTNSRKTMYKELRKYIIAYEGKLDRKGGKLFFIWLVKNFPFILDLSCYYLYKIRNKVAL